MSQALAGLAHELNNPLGAVRLHVELIADALGDRTEAAEAEVRESLGMIEECVARMQSITTNLRRIARGTEPGQREELCLGDLVERVLAASSRRISDSAISVEVDSSAATVSGDSGQLSEAIGHVLRNAIEAVEDSKQRRIAIRIWLDVTEVACRISDSGAGFFDGALEKAGQPFFTTKARGAGLGLGLAIAKSIVAAHGGGIVLANSGEGQGACVTLRLPA